MEKDYQRISAAIDYLSKNFRDQPDLERVAAEVHLSPQHFQRVFSRWTGVSPKRFLQVLTVEEAKQRLLHSDNLLDLSQELGLSSSSRLYDHFVSLEALSPGEYQQRGRDIGIYWDVGSSPFGKVLIARTHRGICKLAFIDDPQSLEQELQTLHQNWPLSSIERQTEFAESVLPALFSHSPNPARPLSLHVKGTNFQVQVWRMLMAIQPGSFASYGELATALGHSGARAIGGAVGSNPVALLIPCHRVIRQNGELGGDRWGLTRKRAVLSWEDAKLATQESPSSQVTSA